MDVESVSRWVSLAGDITTGFVLLMVILGGFRGWYVWGRDHRDQLDRLETAHKAEMDRCDEAIAAAAAERAAITRELAELRAIVRDRARP